MDSEVSSVFLSSSPVFWHTFHNRILLKQVLFLAFFRFDYSVHEDRVYRFQPEIRKYYPNLKDGSLEPGYTGIRPKLSGPKQGSADFLIQVSSCTVTIYPEISCIDIFHIFGNTSLYVPF